MAITTMGMKLDKFEETASSANAISRFFVTATKDMEGAKGETSQSDKQRHGTASCLNSKEGLVQAKRSSKSIVEHCKPDSKETYGRIKSSTKWDCERCTFTNPASTSRCEMCNTPRCFVTAAKTGGDQPKPEIMSQIRTDEQSVKPRCKGSERDQIDEATLLELPAELQQEIRSQMQSTPKPNTKKRKIKGQERITSWFE